MANPQARGADGVEGRGASDEADHPGEPHLQSYLAAVLTGQRQAALDVALELVASGVSVADIYSGLLQPAQYELGRLWEGNRISVAAEHMGTAVTQFVVAQLYTRIPIPPHTAGRAIITGVEGELHQLGSNMVADMLEADGWNVRFLGTQTPHRDVMRAIEEHEPALVGISATMLFNMPQVVELVDMIRRTARGGPRVVVGGGAFRSSPALWREVGADGYAADLKGAVAIARQLAAAG